MSTTPRPDTTRRQKMARASTETAAMWGMNQLLYAGPGRAHTVAECTGSLEQAG